MVRHRASLARARASYCSLIRRCSTPATEATENCGRRGSSGSPVPAAVFAEGAPACLEPPPLLQLLVPPVLARRLVLPVRVWGGGRLEGRRLVGRRRLEDLLLLPTALV
jgi:hypothetical protein